MGNSKNTERGKELADEYTWASVVIGVGLTLAFLRPILPREYWRRVFIGFAVAGGPMVA